ncbi:MAG: hypothetical protein RLY20_3251 [Verrucomicrobiota bacterium]
MKSRCVERESPGRDYLRSKGRSTGEKSRAGEEMPAGRQVRRCCREDAAAYLGGQAGYRGDLGHEQNWEQLGSRDCQASVLGSILRLLQSAAGAAVVCRRVTVSGFHGAAEEFEAGDGFKLAMRGDGQPEKGCQGKHDGSKTPHAGIDTRRAADVQTYLVMDSTDDGWSWEKIWGCASGFSRLSGYAVAPDCMGFGGCSWNP